jgi:hypothetical protein
MAALQSSSMPLQVSATDGFTAATVSSQSRAFVAVAAG